MHRKPHASAADNSNNGNNNSNNIEISGPIDTTAVCRRRGPNWPLMFELELGLAPQHRPGACSCLLVRACLFGQFIDFAPLAHFH